MAKNILCSLLLLSIIMGFSIAPGHADICETHSFGAGNAEYFIYAYGKAFNFTAEQDMLIESVETTSILATQYSGTFHFRIEVNDAVVAAMDQYVANLAYQPYVHSQDICVSLRK